MITSTDAGGMHLDELFTYRDCVFRLIAQSDTSEAFVAKVIYLEGPLGKDEVTLPQDADAYGTLAESLRHGQQQAMRWVHDRTGDGQGQF